VWGGILRLDLRRRRRRRRRRRAGLRPSGVL
jgi:hypothetical protein